jgi:beta-N-acetylhexosaminidase
MTAHLHVPAWDSQTATMSSVALNDWLRGQMGFKGVIITDDLEMGAITGAAAIPAAARQALMAGADLLLICSQEKAAWEAAALLDRDPSLHQRVADSRRRLELLRKQVARVPVDLAKVKVYFKRRG